MKSMSLMKGGRIPSSETPPPKHRSARTPKENVDPSPSSGGAAAPPYRSPNVPLGKPPLASKNRSPIPPRPPLCPSGNPLKRKLNVDSVADHGAAPAVGSDSGVQVILRMRPLIKEVEEGDQILQKISSDSVLILDHTFTFDSVADAEATQQDIFQLVGVPLVENCLAGFNSSIFAYGQTGSGKTYTMWGPLNALSKDNNLSSSKRGLTPRVFEQLFSRIKEEQVKHSNKQLNYQCRCSLLEIYNEQIMDLLEPTQKNLQIRKDVQTGVYVENLTEDYVCSVKDVIQLLVKGLENRRTCATSINAESSRSHCVFTCIVESRSKCTSDGLSSVRTSRINLVDLAGSERQKQTGAAGERLKEAGNINRSLSQLGNLINILAEVSQSGKQRHIPYRDSRLTFLLQESLGGNAKLAMICAVSPSQSCKNETISTLRFAQRAKAIKNKAVINEVTQDDVNVLREQIRQLKDELLRVKSNGGSAGNNGSFSTGWNARRSLNILKQSLGRPMLIQIEEDDDEEMEIDDADVEKPFTDGAQVIVSKEFANQPNKRSSIIGSSAEVSSSICESKLVSGDLLSKETHIRMEVCESENTTLDQLSTNHADNNDLKVIKKEASKSLIGLVRQHIESEESSENNLLTESNLKGGKNSSRKCLRTSSSMSVSRGHLQEAVCSSSAALDPLSALNLVKNSTNVSMARTSIKSLVPTEDLASSLHQGLQVLDSYQQMSPLGRSSFRFKPVEIKSPVPLAKVNFGTQTPQGQETSEGLSLYMCDYCKNRTPTAEAKDVGVDRELQLVLVDEPSYGEKPLQVPKAVEKVLAGAIRREMVLEDYCAKKDAEISHLNRLVQQYKHERECNTLIDQAREGKISRLEDLINDIIPSEHYLNEELMSLANEHMLLKEKYENHPEVLKMMVEMKRLQDELDAYRNFCEHGEKEVLTEEIQGLRYQLQYYIDSSSIPIRKQGSLLKLTYLKDSMAVERSTALCHAASSEPSDENHKFGEERRHLTESESKWIVLVEELGRDLEATRSLSENLKLELDSEKKCSEELKEALQTAMQARACILDQYADLQEKHIELLAWNRKIRDGITDVENKATTTGVKDVESSLIDALATEISALKEEREKERRYWKAENKGLQAQLRDTAEAVQAAGELLVRLKEAEEATAIAQKRTIAVEEEAKEARLEIDSLNKQHGTEIALLNQFLAKSCSPKDALRPPSCYDNKEAKYEGSESFNDQGGRMESEPCHLGNVNNFCDGAEHPSWFSDYDRCNI